MSDVREQIEALVEQRQLCWKNGRSTHAVENELQKAYDTLRRSQAAGLYGSMEEITRRARVERQLEMLMSDTDD